MAHRTAAGLTPPDDRTRFVGMLDTLRERAKTLVELVEQGRFYFDRPASYDEKAAQIALKVPIGITSRVPQTDSIAILIEKNPNILAAVFDLPAGTDATVSTRVKMAQTSNVHAVVKAEGKYYVASKEIKVTIGGCGG